MSSEALNSIVLAAASVPVGGGYVNPFKIVAIIALMLGWGLIVQWVDKDTDLVKTKRELWNSIVMAGGTVGFLLFFLAPWKGPLFFAGLFAWILFSAGTCIAYVIHRNGRVVPQARVLTADHARRLMASDPSKKNARTDKGQRVRMLDHKGKPINLPDDAEEAEDYYSTQEFLFEMLWRRASDVDILAGREKYRVVQKIDGVASEKPEGMPTEEGERVFRFLKRIAGLNPEEVRRPQTGKIQVALLAHVGEPPVAEVHTSGTTAGERLRIRSQGSTQLLRVADLGLAEQRLEKIKELMQKKGGLVLVSSPAQHGQTTTQYALVRGHDAFMQNIYTLEKQTMMTLDNVTQFTYDGQNNDVNYARMLQTVLRREPDIAMVSDCDDRETAQIAARAAIEEKRIYLGIKAKDCFDALSQYTSLLEDNSLASRALTGVINHRLVRKLCTECREAFRPDPETLKKLNLPAKIERFYRPPTEPILDKKGHEIICPNCQGTGYYGRVGVFEVLEITPDIARLIAEGAAIAKIKAEARKNKMYYLQEEGLLKVIDGTTSMNEILRVMRDNGK